MFTIIRNVWHVLVICMTHLIGISKFPKHHNVYSIRCIGCIILKPLWLNHDIDVSLMATDVWVLMRHEVTSSRIISTFIPYMRWHKYHKKNRLGSVGGEVYDIYTSWYNTDSRLGDSLGRFTIDDVIGFRTNWKEWVVNNNIDDNAGWLSE